MATLRLANGDIVLSPLWPWRRLLRMPDLRIPLERVAAVWSITWGVKFIVPGEPDLDGARFYGWWYQPLDRPELAALLQERGIPTRRMPLPQRGKGLLHDFAVSQRPGWIWRDRGWLAFLESAVALLLGVGVLVALDFFSDVPVGMLVWVGFIVAVVLWSSFAGHRYRKRMRR